MDDHDTRELAWSYNPWRANWRKSAAALALELAVAALAGFSFTWPNWWPDMIGWGFFALLLLFGMTLNLFLPVRYRLDEKGVMVRFLGAPSFRKWEHYRNFYPHRTGVHLTTMPRPSALDPFRGHLLLYSGNKEQVDSYIEEHLTLRGRPLEE